MGGLIWEWGPEMGDLIWKGLEWGGGGADMGGLIWYGACNGGPVMGGLGL